MEWVNIAKDLGVPTAILAALLWMLWKAGSFCAVQVIVPWRDRHFAFLTSVEKTTGSLAKTLDRIETLLEQQAARLEAIAVDLQKEQMG